MHCSSSSLFIPAFQSQHEMKEKFEGAEKDIQFFLKQKIPYVFWEI